MISIKTFKKIALSFPCTEEKLHFDRTAFKVTGKRIFATLDEESETANLKFLEVDQSVYCSFNKDAVYPVPNKFGLQGWTTFELAKLSVELISDALLMAYNAVLQTKKIKK